MNCWVIVKAYRVIKRQYSVIIGDCRVIVMHYVVIVRHYIVQLMDYRVFIRDLYYRPRQSTVLGYLKNAFYGSSSWDDNKKLYHFGVILLFL